MSIHHVLASRTLNLILGLVFQNLRTLNPCFQKTKPLNLILILVGCKWFLDDVAIFALQQVMLVGFRRFRVWFLDDLLHLHIVPG
jgi:hypothetical protein